MPVSALANAGVVLTPSSPGAPVALAVATALALGKRIGIPLVYGAVPEHVGSAVTVMVPPLGLANESMAGLETTMGTPGRGGERWLAADLLLM